jgi:hypothetical protein
MISSFNEVMGNHPSVVLALMWAIAMLSYHQDVKHPRYRFGLLSQMVAVTCLVAIVFFSFTHGEWWNFLIVAALLWLHVQFTRRWRARPSAWW